MRPSAISLGLILLWAASAPLSAAERITVELRPGEGVTCAELTTPRLWTVPSDVPDNDSGLLRAGGFHRAGADFEFRQGEKLLVSIFTGSRINLYSPDKYAVIQQNSKLALTSATEVEWQSGRVLPRFERHVGGEAANGQPFPYAGRTFAVSGRYWWGAADISTRLSIDQAYIALFTWDGTVSYPDPFGAFQSNRRDGHYFIDLYNVATGRKLALIRGRFHDVPPGNFASKSFWIEGPRFVMPVSENMRRLVLCEVR